MKVRAVVVVVMVLLGTIFTAPSVSAAVTPSVTVSKTTGLTNGKVVTVTGRGITPGAEVEVTQCDQDIPPDDQYQTPCPAVTTTTASSTGKVKLKVALVNLTSTATFGEQYPVYCRNDGCRIFLAWTDADQVRQVVQSSTLGFKGSTATIAATPSSGLPDQKWVTVTGKVHGARGHRIQVFEEGCVDIVQSNDCSGQLPAKSGKVKHDETYRVRYHASRYLADGTDCANLDPFLSETCRITVAVLDSSGQPDDSFGVSRLGQPGVTLSFTG